MAQDYGDGSRIGTIRVTTAGPDGDTAIAAEIARCGGAPGVIDLAAASAALAWLGP